MQDASAGNHQLGAIATHQRAKSACSLIFGVCERKRRHHRYRTNEIPYDDRDVASLQGDITVNTFAALVQGHLIEQHVGHPKFGSWYGIM